MSSGAIVTDLSVSDQHKILFAEYNPFVPNHRTLLSAWMSDGSNGNFTLRSIFIQLPSQFTNLSDYYFDLTGKSLVDFFNKIDTMFPGLKVGNTYDGNELSLYITML